MNREPVLGLAPMLEALGIKQAASFNDCYALLGELFAVTRCSPKPSELSGNEWCALVNLALARHNLLNSAHSGAAAEHAAQADARIAELEAALAEEQRRPCAREDDCVMQPHCGSEGKCMRPCGAALGPAA